MEPPLADGKPKGSAHEVSLLFTSYSDLGGRFLSFIAKRGFSHVSVSVDADCAVFYSFNRKGFAIEKPLKHAPKKRLSRSLLLSFEVPDEPYEALCEEIERFLERRPAFSYARIGLLLCLAHVPFKFENRRFCSQFVAEVLERAGIAHLASKPELCLPEHLIDRAAYAYPVTRTVDNWIEGCQPPHRARQGKRLRLSQVYETCMHRRDDKRIA